MRAKKIFYRIVRGGSRRNGIIFMLIDGKYGGPVEEDGRPLADLSNVTFELRNGEYPIYSEDHGFRFLCEELKEVFEKYADKEYVEFIPVKITSKEYGDRIFYIMHFKKLYDDIVYPKYSKYIDDTAIVVGFKHENVKDLNVFTSGSFMRDTYISKRVMEEIKEKDLKHGFVYYHNGSFL